MQNLATVALAAVLLAAVPALAAPGARECRRDPDCNDGNACTADRCDRPTKTCRHTPATNGTVCSDGDLCTQSDTCQAGVCVGGNPVACIAADVCHVAGTCDPATGTCSDPAAPDGTACDDLDYCTQTDVCQAGACVGTQPVVCSAVDACHLAGTCDPATGVCSNPPVNPLVCTPVDQCNTAGTCDPATGACTTPLRADGSACTDGDACTQADTCQAGACVGADPVVCGAMGSCESDGTCDPLTGDCVASPLADGTPCDSGLGLLCGEPDVCQAGVCVAGGGGDSDGDGVCDATDDCAGVPDTQSDLDGDGIGDACDADDGPLAVTVASVRRGAGGRHADMTATARGGFVAGGALDVADGATARVRDGMGLDVTQSWSAAECRRARSGRRVLCRAAGDPSSRLKLRLVAPGDARFTVRLGHLAPTPPFGAPVTVTVSLGMVDRVGTTSDCRVLPTGLACGHP